MHDSYEDENAVDLSGLSENDLALHESLSSILSCEDGVLHPDDADGLALVIVNEIPPVYNAAPDLLEACKKVLASIEHNIADDALPETRECLRAAIALATGYPVST